MESLPTLLKDRIQNKKYIYNNKIITCVGKHLICKHNLIIQKCKYCNNINKIKIIDSNNKKIINTYNTDKHLLEYIKCNSIEELNSHLETKFIEGMSWDNTDNWKIGYKSFKLSSKNCLIDNFKYTNLRPIWK